MNFHYIPIDSATADRFRRTGVDDGGNPFRQVTADQPKYPCRHCLRKAKPGEHLLLGTYFVCALIAFRASGLFGWALNQTTKDRYTSAVTLSETQGLSEIFFALFRMTIVNGKDN